MSEQEAADYLQYHAAVDADGDGRIDLSELVRYLKPYDDHNQHAAHQHAAALAQLDEVRRGQVAQVEEMKRQLAALGVTSEQVEEAAKRHGSSLCAVM